MYGHPSDSYGRGGVAARAGFGSPTLAIPAELAVFVRRTYGLLLFSVILGAAACWAMIQVMPTQTVMTKRGLATVSAFPQWGLWALWGGTFAFSIMGGMVRSGARQGEASPLGLVALAGLVLCSGAMLGPTIGTYVGLGMVNVVAAAAVTTAITFTALTGLVFISGKNFMSIGKFLFIGLIGLFAAYFVNAFFIRSGEFHWWMSAAGAILFCGYILFHTSAVVHAFGPANMVVPAVISLYIDIYNLFLMLLSLFAGRRQE